LSDELEENGVHFRIFERGLVVVNPDKAKVRIITLPIRSPNRLFDVYEETVIDLTDNKLAVPAYAGRVYLFVPETKDELEVTGPKLTVATWPALAEVCFRVDEIDYWTHRGRWETKYIPGPNFGKFTITFSKPGKHTVEIVDIVPHNLQLPIIYSDEGGLVEATDILPPEVRSKYSKGMLIMDPADPNKPSSRRYRFREWLNLGKTPKIEVDVSEDIVVTALFDIEELEEGEKIE
jgi:hypothetical protein